VDIDVILNRTLVYSTLTTSIIGLYAVIVASLSIWFRSDDNFFISLVGAGCMVVMFQLLHTRLQRVVNRLLYGERDEPYRVIARLGQRLEAAFEPAAVLPTIVQTVSESLKLPYVAIALAQQGQMAIVASTGNPTTETLQIPLTYQGALVGQLHISPRRGETHLSPTDQHLLADLAQQAGVAAHGVQLMTELRQLTSELQRSREQLILAREEERRRLRRDLHDDLAPTLAGLSLTALTIGDLIQTEPTKAAKLSNELHVAMREAVGNIRRLVYDLRPPALDDLGLLAAIRERAAQYSTLSLQVVVIAPEALPPLPAAVEVAAYRIVQEALMNVVKHAQAKTCTVHIGVGAPSGAPLRIEIVDDGVGVSDHHPAGVGLRSMQERAAELGGTCALERMLTGGTRIVIDLPISTQDKAGFSHVSRPAL
jgi:signal transduction histidine kinase